MGESYSSDFDNYSSLEHLKLARPICDKTCHFLS